MCRSVRAAHPCGSLRPSRSRPTKYAADRRPYVDSTRCCSRDASDRFCGGDDTCDPVANTGCDDNQACERVQGGEPTCVAAVVVVGRVFDLESDAGVSGARLVALDANGAAMSFVATSGSDGSYTLPIPITRTSAGAPAESFKITLRADANGYLTFPSGIRPALAFDTSSAVLTDGRYEIASSLTDVGLLKLAPRRPATARSRAGCGEPDECERARRRRGRWRGSHRDRRARRRIRDPQRPGGRGERASVRTRSQLRRQGRRRQRRLAT